MMAWFWSALVDTHANAANLLNPTCYNNWGQCSCRCILLTTETWDWQWCNVKVISLYQLSSLLVSSMINVNFGSCAAERAVDTVLDCCSNLGYTVSAVQCWLIHKMLIKLQTTCYKYPASSQPFSSKLSPHSKKRWLVKKLIERQ